MEFEKTFESGFQQKIAEKIRETIEKWSEQDIYVISFFIHINETYGNIPTLSMCYNTESALKEQDPYSEERWNIAFWFGEEYPIIGDNVEDTPEAKKTTDELLKWYESIGVVEPGVLVQDQLFGEIPRGSYEFYCLVVDVAQQLRSFIDEKFGKPMPLLIHDLEYSELDVFAIHQANPKGEAQIFFDAMENLQMIGPQSDEESQAFRDNMEEEFQRFIDKLTSEGIE